MTDPASRRPLTADEATKPVTEEPDAKVRAWQDKKVRAGIKAADEGRFATGDELRRVVRKYVPDG